MTPETTPIPPSPPPGRPALRRARRVLRALAFALLALLALVGAVHLWNLWRDPRRLAQAATDDGSAAAAVRAKLAGQRVCARVLDGVDPFPLHKGLADLPSVRALIAAGLIEPVPPGTPPDPDVLNFGNDPLYRLTAAAKPFADYHRLGSHNFVYLCYGKPQFGWVYLTASDSVSNPLPILHYTYRIADLPAWARRADMRAAFPLLRVSPEPIHAALGIYFTGRKPDLDDFGPDITDDPDRIAGFSYCPAEGNPQPKGCERD